MFSNTVIICTSVTKGSCKESMFYIGVLGANAYLGMCHKYGQQNQPSGVFFYQWPFINVWMGHIFFKKIPDLRRNWFKFAKFWEKWLIWSKFCSDMARLIYEGVTFFLKNWYMYGSTFKFLAARSWINIIWAPLKDVKEIFWFWFKSLKFEIIPSTYAIKKTLYTECLQGIIPGLFIEIM